MNSAKDPWSGNTSIIYNKNSYLSYIFNQIHQIEIKGIGYEKTD